VNEKLWPPDGVQPTTAAPAATISPAQEGKATLTATCETEGASIGFRRKGERAWAVYVEPVLVEADAEYELVAHRIGFKRSAITPASPRSSG